MDVAETRFAHLLQPIRELTKNWDIDVASELADYLEELDEMCISFDGGKTTLNFAEAALLIQGSACIYSKKVEHLYNLVYQTLDYINDRNKKKDKKAEEAGAEGANAAATKNANVDGGFDSLDQETLDSQHSDMRNESTTNVDVAPLPPEALIPPETSEKQKLLLISVKGEVLGSCKDFRMNTFTPDALGIIHLFLASSQSHFLKDALSDAMLAPIPLLENQGDTELEAGHGMVGIAREDGGDDCGDDGAENLLPLEENGMEVDHGLEEHVERHQAPSEGRRLRERRGVQQLSEEELKKLRMEEELAQAANIWKLHDIYDTVGEDKPLKIGKCYKVPVGLDDSGKRKRKGPSVLPDFWRWYTGTYNPPEPKLKNGPTYKDLNYIYISKIKDKLKTRQRILRKKGVFVSDEELRRTYLQLEEREEANGGEEEDVFRHHDPADLHGDLSDDDPEPLIEDAPAEFPVGQDFIPGADLEGLTYEDLVKKSVEQFLLNSQGYAQETALSKRVKEWEDKIRPELTYQEERPVFDIHDYGDRIVAAFSSVGHRRTFASVVYGMDNFEACKYMLASLQLANDCTLDIDKREGLEESIDTMGLTLLSKQRANHRFKNAPGASEGTSDHI
ncbi:hypothetical protein UPYG_G00345750 [Umbra pygmaea]|uniref:Condensin-2 complex subunit H2 n=1 Tax=Umbra pygmaea TaxID=75934 RepID=A0ABD0W1W0_UMBPY